MIPCSHDLLIKKDKCGSRPARGVGGYFEDPDNTELKSELKPEGEGGSNLLSPAENIKKDIVGVERETLGTS